jgi:hypothetical protein
MTWGFDDVRMIGDRQEPWPLATLRGALADFYVRDGGLLERKASELAATFRIGHHLILRVGTEWDVDAEYDREGDEGAQKTRDTNQGTHMRPDLVVHRRGKRGSSNNLMFVEVKKAWEDPWGDRDDNEKVRAAIRQHAYQFGVAIGLTQPDAPTDFSPTWTVYTWTGTELEAMARAESVFTDAALRQLTVTTCEHATKPMPREHIADRSES